MGQIYDQLSKEERVSIYHWHASGKSARWIGETLGRHHGTISRELARNSEDTKAWKEGYEPLRAQALALRRRRRDSRFKLARQPTLRTLVRSKLAMGWSPEMIAGRLAREQSSMRISHESIYRYAYARSAQRDYWHRWLPQKKHRRGWLGTRGGSAVDNIQNRVSIAERPPHVENRREPGHLEADMMGFRERRHNLLVALERTSRFVWIAKTPNRTSAVVLARLRRWFSRLPSHLRRSLTQDNGPEFAKHHKLATHLGLRTYFCDPHSPWQRGTCENTNGLLRQMLPKGTDLSVHDQQALDSIADLLNNRPRQTLNWRSPIQAFRELVNASAQMAQTTIH